MERRRTRILNKSRVIHYWPRTITTGIAILCLLGLTICGECLILVWHNHHNIRGREAAVINLSSGLMYLLICRCWASLLLANLSTIIGVWWGLPENRCIASGAHITQLIRRHKRKWVIVFQNDDDNRAAPDPTVCETYFERVTGITTVCQWKPIEFGGGREGIPFVCRTALQPDQPHKHNWPCQQLQRGPYKGGLGALRERPE